MFVRLPVLTVLACVLLAGSGGNAQRVEHLSPRQAKLLAQTAHTSVDFEKLADYFHAQSLRFQKRAADEEIIMRRDAEHMSGTKYPSSYETAHRLHDYYRQRAQDAAANAAAYERRSQASGAATASR